MKKSILCISLEKKLKTGMVCFYATLTFFVHQCRVHGSWLINVSGHPPYYTGWSRMMSKKFGGRLLEF